MTEDYTRDESEAQRHDRHWIELLQELRLAQTGTQILFAFLLAIAFTTPFRDSDAFTHAVFAVTLICAGLATSFLIAPVSLHRFLYRRKVRPRMVTIAGALTHTGLALLLASVCGGLLLALDVVMSRGWAIVTTSVVVLVFIGTWYVLPLVVRPSK